MITATTGAISLPVLEVSQVGEARRLAAAMARGLGFNATELSNVSLLATEAANNLVKHAGGGQLILHCLEDGGMLGLEILSLDKGAGMVDVERCMQDGYSTAGSPGTGLGAMARVSSLFDIHSLPGQGTVLLMRIWEGGRQRQEKKRAFVIGGLSVPMPTEPVCGDAWATVEISEGLVMMVSDGLGHGPLASEASEEAVRIFRETPDPDPEGFLQLAHRVLRKTRGAAIGVARIDLGEETIRFAGIGNIAASVLSEGGSRSMISHNGIVGHEMRKVQEMTYPWPRDGLLVMHSDGIQTRWGLDNLPGLSRRHPALIAGWMYRDFKRSRDDVTVALSRCTPS